MFMTVTSCKINSSNNNEHPQLLKEREEEGRLFLLLSLVFFTLYSSPYDFFPYLSSYS